MPQALINWLNNEPADVVLQRDNAFAMLTWKDFNQPQEAFMSMQSAAWIFILTVGIPVLLLA